MFQQVRNRKEAIEIREDAGEEFLTTTTIKQDVIKEEQVIMSKITTINVQVMRELAGIMKELVHVGQEIEEVIIANYLLLKF